MHFFLCLKLITSHVNQVTFCHKSFLSSFKLSGQETDFLTFLRLIADIFAHVSCFCDSICFFFNNDPPVKPKEKYIQYLLSLYLLFVSCNYKKFNISLII